MPSIEIAGATAGYPGAKAAIKFITSYAAAESERNGLGIRFVSVLPQLTPTTLGAVGAAAYAGREGVDMATFLENLGPALTPGAGRQGRHRSGHLRARPGGLPAHRRRAQPGDLTPG